MSDVHQSASPPAAEPSLLLRDGGGNYYVFSAAQVAEARVPADQAGAVAAALRGDEQGDEDVAGYFWHWFFRPSPQPSVTWFGGGMFTMPIGNNLHNPSRMQNLEP